MNENFENACKKAYEYFNEQELYGLCVCKDLGSEWMFEAGNPKEVNYALRPIVVEKETGKISTVRDFYEYMDKLSSTEKIEIPEKYRFKELK